jgi:NADPH2:quinone reductase
LPKPQPAKDRVLVRVTAAGVTPLEYTVLSGGYPRAKPPLVLVNEGGGVIEDAGDSSLAVRSRVMFTGPYGVGENGAWQEWLLVRPEHLALVPDAIDDVVAASLPVAYLMVTTGLAWLALTGSAYAFTVTLTPGPMDPLYFASEAAGQNGFTLDGVTWTGSGAAATRRRSR